MPTTDVPIRAMAADPGEFRRSVLIDTDAGPRPFDACLDDWQRADFAAMDPAWRRAAGHAVEAPVSRSWLERCRGAGKTTSLAVTASWLLAFSRRQVSIICAAVDRDQAAVLRGGIATLVRLNPWLGEALDCQAYRIVNSRTGSTLDVLSSDVGSSYGVTPTAVICDEVALWPTRDLFDSLLSSSAKRAHSVFCCITNAGFTESWAWPVREAVRVDPCWYFHSLDRPASWITAEHLDQQRRLLPRQVYERLWNGVWVRGEGDALDLVDIEASVTQDKPMTGTEPNYTFVAGLDLGIRHDHSALCIVGKHTKTNRMRLALCRSWQPGVDGKVDLQAVQDDVLDAKHDYRLAAVYYDPYQCDLLASQLTKEQVNMVEIAFVGKSLNEMATVLLNVFRSRELDLYRDQQLIRDLGRLTIVEKSYGYRLEANRTATEGHADKATSLALALLAAQQVKARRPPICGMVFGRYDNDAPSFTPPSSLRGIIRA